MALMKFEVGAELDIATGDELNGAVKSIMKGNQTPKPIHLSFAAQNNSNYGASVIYLGRPPIGKAWKLQSFAIMGVDPWTTLASALAALCIGDVSNPGPPQVRAPGRVVPSWETANGELWAQSGEDVFYYLNTQAAAATCTGTLTLEEWTASDVISTFDKWSGA